MLRLRLAVAAVSLAGPALAQDFTDRTRELNALRDGARAEERQADELRRLRQIEADLARTEDRTWRNAATMGRSNRRFDERAQR